MVHHPEVMGIYHVNEDIYNNDKVTYQKDYSDGSEMYVFSFPYGIDYWKWDRIWRVRNAHLSITLF